MASRQHGLVKDRLRLKVERKLAEMVRYHGGRRARYRGQARLKIQFLLVGLVVNIKRIVRLVTSSLNPPALQQPDYLNTGRSKIYLCKPPGEALAPPPARGRLGGGRVIVCFVTCPPLKAADG